MNNPSSICAHCGGEILGPIPRLCALCETDPQIRKQHICPKQIIEMRKQIREPQVGDGIRLCGDPKMGVILVIEPQWRNDCRYLARWDDGSQSWISRVLFEFIVGAHAPATDNQERKRK